MVIKTFSLISQLLWECFYNASVKCYTSFWVEMDTFYHIKDVPPISTLSRVSVEFCQVSFSIDEDNHVVFFLFYPIHKRHYIHGFLNTESALLSWNKAHLVMVHIL